MADDLAFLFDDPAPRSARRAVEPTTQAVPRRARQLSADIDWLTLRQAHDRTSIPIATLRKWARKGKVRARLTRVEGKELRFVAFGDVVDRARSLDRVVEPVVVDLRDPEEGRAVATPVPVETRIDPVATVASVSSEPPPAAGATPEVPIEDPAAPEGSILVPIDAWDRLLGQLGNLHEAGQQLADARERAAKAETESDFLKERLREMRKRAEQAELALQVHSNAELLPEASPPPEPVLRIGWRRLRDRWIGK